MANGKNEKKVNRRFLLTLFKILSLKAIFTFVILAFFLSSCKKAVSTNPIKTNPAYNNVLILGNSITYSPANPGAGWNGSWGMAASAADSDFVHRLTVHFKSVNQSAVVTAVNIAAFERDFNNYDLVANLLTYKALKPDLIIVRIGENVTTTDSVGFDKRYTDLLNYFKANNPNVKILAFGSVWLYRDLANNVMAKHSDYVSLVSLASDLSNYAFGLFTDPGIQNHPCDKGMRAISDRIWQAVEKSRN